MLLEACRAAARWNWDGRIAVNLSGAQLQLSDVGEMVADTLLATGLAPSRLDLEVTESVLVGQDEALTRSLSRLRDLGVGIAIDDFGTGYSSLSYLSALEFDKLKIDQSFIRRLEDGAADLAIVEAIVDLAKRLGKITVAEGVETQRQRALVTQMGCDICQGWLSGKPLPAAEFEELLADVERAA